MTRMTDKVFSSKLKTAHGVVSADQKAGDNVLGRSRNGVVRNTDSFFKDDTVETKKISLTPNLLRDDSNTSSMASDPKEVVAHLCKVSVRAPS
jgi:hypothetical protein